jgi:hypothetical protein
MTAAENWILNVSTRTQRLSALRGAAIFQKTKHPIPSHRSMHLFLSNTPMRLYFFSACISGVVFLEGEHINVELY